MTNVCQQINSYAKNVYFCDSDGHYFCVCQNVVKFKSKSDCRGIHRNIQRDYIAEYPVLRFFLRINSDYAKFILKIKSMLKYLSKHQFMHHIPFLRPIKLMHFICKFVKLWLIKWINKFLLSWNNYIPIWLSINYLLHSGF